MARPFMTSTFTNLPSDTRRGVRQALPFFPFQTRLHAAITCRISAGLLTLAALLALAPVVSVAQHQPGLIPESSVQQENVVKVPAWKRLWDEGRMLAREGSYSDAVGRYERLLREKKDLHEARWELAVILLHLGRKEEGAQHLELLLEADSERVEYLNKLAEVVRARGHAKRASELYRRAYEKNPASREALTGLAMSLLEADAKKEALSYLEALYRQKPGDDALRKKLAVLYYDLGINDKAIKLLAALVEQGKPSLDNLLMTARVYDRLGKGNKAVGYWQRVVVLDPGNTEAHSRLAAFYENEGRVAEALISLQSLLRKSPRDPQLLSQIGKIYMEIGKSELALPYLERYLELKPQDRDMLQTVAVITIQLAHEYLDKGELDKTRDYLARLGETARQTSEFLLVRGTLLEKLHRPEQAIQDYELFLEKNPDRRDIRLRIIRLAGDLGDLQKLTEQYARLSPLPPLPDGASERLIYARALVVCGDYGNAFRKFMELQASEKLGRDDVIQIYLGLADLYQALGLFYQAEQSLRMAMQLTDNQQDILIRLFDHALLMEKDVAEASNWLARLIPLTDSPHGSGTSDILKQRTQLLRARLLSTQRANRSAIRLARRLFEQSAAEEVPASVAPGLPFNPEAPVGRMRRQGLSHVYLGLELAKILLAGGKGEAAKDLLLGLTAYDVNEELELLVLLQRAYELEEEYDRAGETFAAALAAAERDLGTLFTLWQFYWRLDRPVECLKVVVRIRERGHSSLRGSLLYAEILKRVGAADMARISASEILAAHPQNLRAAALDAELSYQQGNYLQSLQACEKILLHSKGLIERPDIILLKARSLWALNRWQESADVYRSYLKPSVDELFQAEVGRAGINYRQKPVRKSLWDYITFSKPATPRLLEQVLVGGPTDADARESRMLQDVATPFYARFRWQAIFADEMEARRAVLRHEYMRAATLYEGLTEDSPKDESLLFDLAGVYSRLGRLGDEAAIYEKIAGMNQNYPGLTDAVERNRLKRRPRFSGGYGMQREEGWDDYKNIKKEWLHADLHYSPLIQHELDLSFSRIRYQAVSGEDIFWAKRLFMDYQVDFLGGMSFSLGAGMESPDESFPQTGLWRCSLGGKLGDKISGYLQGQREVVADTLASLGRNVVRQDLGTGFGVDLLPRLSCGLDYDYWNYSDGINTQGYDLWVSYILVQEPTLLKLSYTYDFKDSSSGPRPGIPLPDGFAIDDHPYWLPVNYWRNIFCLSFRHQLSKDTLERGTPSFYTLEYSPGYDSRGFGVQTVSGSLSAEWTPHILAELAGKLVTSQIYRSREIFFSVGYRW